MGNVYFIKKVLDFFNSRRLIIKFKLNRSKKRFNRETKFNIGDKVSVINVNDLLNGNSAFIFNEIFSNDKIGEIVDIYMGSKYHSHQDWYYEVVFTYRTSVDKKIKMAFNEWEIELDKSYLRSKKLKELGI